MNIVDYGNHGIIKDVDANKEIQKQIESLIKKHGITRSTSWINGNIDYHIMPWDWIKNKEFKKELFWIALQC